MGALWVQGKRPAAVPGAKDPVLGDILVVIAQVAAALQFIIEEKYLAQYRSVCRIELAACALDARTAPWPWPPRAQLRTQPWLIPLMLVQCFAKYWSLLVRRVPALFGVGLEGAWGLLISCAALPILALVKGPNGMPLDSLPAALREIRASWRLQVCWSHTASFQAHTAESLR